MSAANLIPPATTDELRRKRFSRSEVRHLMDLGVFVGQRYELIEGDLIDKMGQHPPHAFSLGAIVAWLTDILGIRKLRIQLPIEVACDDQERSSPEPDVAVLVEIKPEYQTRHPRGDELLLIVEVPDTSAQFDLTVKAKLYARAAVPEYWVLDIRNRWLIVHRHPVDGEYRQVIRLAEQEQANFEYRSGEHTIVVSELMPALLS